MNGEETHGWRYGTGRALLQELEEDDEDELRRMAIERESDTVSALNRNPGRQGQPKKATSSERSGRLTSISSSLASPCCPHSHNHFGSPATHRAAAFALTSLTFGFESDEGKAGVEGREKGAM